MIDKRTQFLEKFLQLVGAKKIQNLIYEDQKVFGTIIFDDGETQEFCWNISQENLPSVDVIELMEILKKNNFISIDKLIVSQKELFNHTKWKDYQKFETALNELFNIEVKMIDDDEETDSFFIHD